MATLWENFEHLGTTVYYNLRGITLDDVRRAQKDSVFSSGASALFGGGDVIVDPIPTGESALSPNNLKESLLSSLLLATPVGKTGAAALLAAKTGSMGVKQRGIAALIMRARGLLSGRLFITLGIFASIGAIYAYSLRTTQYVWNFNWQISDKELDQQLKNKLDALYGMLGGLAGSTLGYLVCGALPGVAAFAFNPAAARVILGGKGPDGKFEPGTLTEEASDEVRAQLASLTNGAFQALTNAQILRSFQGIRRWLKRPGTPFYEILKASMGKDFEKWGEEGRPAWSFAIATEERIEKIKDPRLRNFTEEFVENFADSCIESGYIVADGISTAMAAQKLMQQQLLGAQRTVEITFDRSST